MKIVARFIALLVAAGAGVSMSASPPRCVGEATSSESGISPHVASPNVSPGRGRAGTTVSIRGYGFAPGTVLTIVGLYAENRCVIQGLGDQYLGSTRADARGGYALSARWPATFDPVLGRNTIVEQTLPRGRYFVFALPCAQRATCSLTAGTMPGGPFVLETARASPLGWILIAVVVCMCVAGARVAIRRRTR
jgi:hypothetical protein